MAAQPMNVLELGKTPASTVLKLSWPTILEQIAFTVLNFADTAMVGVLGAACTAAVGITAPVLWLVNGIIAAVSVGFSVQVAQDVGAGDLDRASSVIRQAFVFSALSGGALTLICFLLTPVLPALMGAEDQVLPLAGQYFGVVCFSFFFNSLETVMAATLRCMGNTRTPMTANIIAIVLNIFLNWLFIFPPLTVQIGGNSFTIPRAGMGPAGAALGTVLSIGAATVLILLPLLRGKSGLKLSLGGKFSFDGPVLVRAAFLGIPVALERITMSLGQVAYLRIVSTMGTTAVAAHHLAVQAESLSYLPSFGFSVAATTLVGQSVGASQPEKGLNFGRIAVHMGFACMSVTGVVLFVVAAPIISIFTRDAAVIALGASLLRVVAFAQPGEAWANIYTGALRGAGDSRWPFYINLVGVWGIRVLLAVIFVFGFGLGLQWVWVAMFADLTFRGIVCRRRFLRQNWYH